MESDGEESSDVHCFCLRGSGDGHGALGIFVSVINECLIHVLVILGIDKIFVIFFFFSLTLAVGFAVQ